jgi:hypothetical protein
VVDKNYPCKCEHVLVDHIGFSDVFGFSYPTGCMGLLEDNSACFCWEFKADNLKYLEAEALRNGY